MVGEKRVGRLMKQEGIWGASRRRRGPKTTRRNEDARPVVDLVERKLHGRRTRPALGRRHHVYPGFRRVPLPGRRARCVEPPSDRLGHGRRTCARSSSSTL